MKSVFFTFIWVILVLDYGKKIKLNQTEISKILYVYSLYSLGLFG